MPDEPHDFEDERGYLWEAPDGDGRIRVRDFDGNTVTWYDPGDDGYADAIVRLQSIVTEQVNFPMPNDRVTLATPNANVPRTAADEVERIVVASCYTSDDECLLLVLNPAAPYYTVAEVALASGECVVATAFDNINFAVHEYAQSGGDV